MLRRNSRTVFFSLLYILLFYFLSIYIYLLMVLLIYERSHSKIRPLVMDGTAGWSRSYMRRRVRRPHDRFGLFCPIGLFWRDWCDLWSVMLIAPLSAAGLSHKDKTSRFAGAQFMIWPFGLCVSPREIGYWEMKRREIKVNGDNTILI